MNRYIARRLLMLIPVFIGITLLNFLLLNLLPGDAVDAMVDPRAANLLSPVQLQARREALGLDKPWLIRYGIWLQELARGNMGYSYITQEPVLAKLQARLGPTLKLTTVSFAAAVILGITLGVFSALKRYSLPDYLLTIWTYVNVSVPGFFAALIIVYIFAIHLRWFPTSGIRDYSLEPSLLNELRHMVLPAFALMLGSWATVMRYCRTSMLEVLNQDYLTTARAKGLTENLLIRRHALRNALLPVITIIGLSIPGLISGSILIETVFGWPGMGQLAVISVHRRDSPVVMGVTVIFSIMVLLSNLLTDIIYAIVDPRIRYE